MKQGGKQEAAPIAVSMTPQALLAALRDGLTMWSHASGAGLPGVAHEIAVHQLAAIRRAASRPPAPAPEEARPADEADATRWWDR